MASGWQGAPYFNKCGRELVSKPAISLKKSWGGYRRTTLSYAASVDCIAQRLRCISNNHLEVHPGFFEASYLNLMWGKKQSSAWGVVALPKLTRSSFSI